MTAFEIRLFSRCFVETEDSAMELRKQIEAKAGEITDVVVCMGRWTVTGPVLSQSVQQYQEVISNTENTLRMNSQFLSMI